MRYKPGLMPTYYGFPSNTNYGIFYSEVLSWQNKPDANGPHPAQITSVLDSVKIVFEEFFDCDYVNTRKVAIFPHPHRPRNFKDHSVIFLSARSGCWNKYIYQFSHELCHLMIEKNIEPEFRWFEESLCEMASLFFLKQIPVRWAKQPPSIDAPERFTSEVPNYFSATLEGSAVLPEGYGFDQYIVEKLPSLASDSYKRDINMLCAKTMLPVFEQTPELWLDVHCLPDSLQGHASSINIFYEYLQQWKNLAKHKDAVNDIISLYYPG